MEKILVIDYTELNYPLDGFKYNEGHVISESLRKSELDHIVISTGDKYPIDSCGEHNNFNHDRYYFDQGDIAEKCFGAEIISPGNTEKQEIFDFDKNWFKPGYLESMLEKYDSIIINFHSLVKEHLDIVDNFEDLPKKKVKLNYTVHNSRDVPIRNKELGKRYRKFFNRMDSFISFSEAFTEELGLPENRVRYAKLGVDEEVYKLSERRPDELVVGANLLEFYRQGNSISGNMLMKFFKFKKKAKENIKVIIDYAFGTKHNMMQFRDYRPDGPYKRVDIPIKGIDVVENVYDLTQNSNWDTTRHHKNIFNEIDVFFSFYYTKDIDVAVLKALMSGVPIILPDQEHHTDIINKDNSITFLRPGSEFYHSDKSHEEKRRVYNSNVEKIASFDKTNFDRELIRRQLIEKGYTAKEMISKYDSCLRSVV